MKLTVAGMYGPYPKKEFGADSCYLVQGENVNLVMDMGPGSLSNLQKIIDIDKIDYIWLSHLHFDHTSDFLTFRYLLEDLNHKVKLIARKIDSPWYDILVSHPLIEVINVDESSVLNIENLTLRFYPMKHTVECDCIKITEHTDKGDKVLVYTGDTLYNDNIPTACKNADFIIADCSKPANFKGPHMTYIQGLELQKSTGAFVLSTHLNVDYSPEEEYNNNDKIKVAKIFDEYEI